MGETPTFTCKAHVFTIDQRTKKTWLPASNSQVDVSFFFDPNRECYRIVSVEETESAGKKIVINSNISEKMSFKKTSQKFGQWADPKASTVYGLGFANESELERFAEYFAQSVDKVRRAGGTAGTGSSGSSRQGSISGSTSQQQQLSTSANGSVGDQQNLSLGDSNGGTNEPDYYVSSASTTSSIPPATTAAPLSTTPALSSVETEALKMENERLKLQLNHANANAKKWELELNTLRRNNNDLMKALQESAKNVEEWKKTVQAYSDECQRLRTAAAGQQDVHTLTAQLDQLRVARDQDQQRIEAAERDKTSLVERYKIMEAEHRELAQLTADASARLSEISSIHTKMHLVVNKRL